MAVSRLKTWVAAETLTASDLNAEFNNLINNGEDLSSPATQTLDMDGQKLVLDGDADTSITSDTDDRIDFELSGTDLFRLDGTATTPVNGLDLVFSATGNAVQIQAVGSDTNITINLVPKGAGTLQIDGVSINPGEVRRRAGLAHFKAQTGRAMAADMAGNMSLTNQVFS